jgi:hypothetical protein
MEQRLAIFANEMREIAADNKSLSHHSLITDHHRGITVEVVVSKAQPKNTLGNLVWISADKVYRYNRNTKQMIEVQYYGDMFAHFVPDAYT